MWLHKECMETVWNSCRLTSSVFIKLQPWVPSSVSCKLQNYLVYAPAFPLVVSSSCGPKDCWRSTPHCSQHQLPTVSARDLAMSKYWKLCRPTRKNLGFFLGQEKKGDVLCISLPWWTCLVHVSVILKTSDKTCLLGPFICPHPPCGIPVIT